MSKEKQIWEQPGYDFDPPYPASTPVWTNYDRLVSMTPYELADWIAQILTYHGSFSRRPLTIDDLDCPPECPLYKCCNDQPTDNIEGWLKSPVEVEE